MTTPRDVTRLSPPEASTTSAPVAEDTRPLLEHLDELRRRIIISVAAIVVGMGAGFYAAKPIIGFLVSQTPALGNQTLSLAQLAPGDTLFAAIKIAFVVGLIISSPVWLFQLLRFVLPGLVGREKIGLLIVCISGSVLFLAGLVFGSTLVLPPTLEFLVGYGADIVTTQLAIGNFVSFCMGLLLLMGLSFELPLLLWGLAAIGILNSSHILSRWRETIVLVFVLAAILTPSQDPASLMIVGGMLCALVAISIIPMRLMGK